MSLIDVLGSLRQAETQLEQLGGLGVMGSLYQLIRQGRIMAERLAGAIPHPDAPVIDSPLTASGVRGEAFSYQITATVSPTGSPITSYGATGLPAGLTIDTTTGLISGTPTALVTNRTVRISATNDEGTGRAVLRMTISAPGVGPPTPTIPWATDLTFSFPGIVTGGIGGTPFNFGLNGLIPLTMLTGWDPAYAADFTNAKLYPTPLHAAANVPIRLYATYPAQPEVAVDFDATSDVTPTNAPNKITMWGFSSGDNAIYIEGSNGTGGPIALRLEKP